MYELMELKEKFIGELVYIQQTVCDVIASPLPDCIMRVDVVSH